MRIELEFRDYDPATGTLALTDPASASCFTRPDGGGVTVETVADLLDGSHKKETGVFFLDTGEGSGSYTDATWYEVVATATMPSGNVMTDADRHFYYNDTGTATLALSAPTLSGVVNDSTGSSVTATVAPASGQSAHPIRILYHQYGGAVADGGSRTGAGTVQLTGLTENAAYFIQAAHERSTDANQRSYPSDGIWVVCHDGTTLGQSVVAGIIAALRGSANLAALAPNWAKTDRRKHVFWPLENAWTGGRSPGRAPFVEVEWVTDEFPGRASGVQSSIDLSARVLIRCTASRGGDIDALVSAVRLCLQTDANRYLGMPSNMIGFRPAVAEAEESLLVKRRLLTLELSMVATPGVNS
ncbi:MAG TPA: hypothetical protein VMW48_00210 [Vicinamibacterales bacterium]|nr:hypothetical protein [Vicinamibacterales bacterium]